MRRYRGCGGGPGAARPAPPGPRRRWRRAPAWAEASQPCCFASPPKKWTRPRQATGASASPWHCSRASTKRRGRPSRAHWEPCARRWAAGEAASAMPGARRGWCGGAPRRRGTPWRDPHGGRQGGRAAHRRPARDRLCRCPLCFPRPACRAGPPRPATAPPEKPAIAPAASAPGATHSGCPGPSPQARRAVALAGHQHRWRPTLCWRVSRSRPHCLRVRRPSTVASHWLHPTQRGCTR
mmetsp:Transcript_24653/g.67707  ORF Transcript_24653/g.67707 Transcript_24653/m.67707 type:complete len:238 (+) Transcript_24653:690-1403(+)